MSTSTVLIVFLAPRLLQAPQFVCAYVCVKGGKRCVRLYLESLQTPSSPFLSPPSSVLSAWRICQFSFSLFVPALILLSKPWLASLTAAEHRSYSTPTNNTHSCHAGMMCALRRTHTLAHKHSRSLLHLLPLSSLTHSKIGNDWLCYHSALSVSCQSLTLSHNPLFAVTLRSHC